MTQSSSLPSAAHFRWSAFFLLVLTVYGSLIPLRFQPLSFHEALTRFQALHYVDPTRVDARGDWIVNAIQYALLSFTLMGAARVDGRRPRTLVTALVVAAFCASVGFALEFLQVFFPPRTVSINDLVVEAIGSLAGVIAWLIFGELLTSQMRRFFSLRGSSGLAIQMLPVYLILLVVTGLMPFDVVISAGEIAQKYSAGRIRLFPLESLFAGDLQAFLKTLLKSVLAMLPLGILLAFLPARIRPKLPAVLGLGLAFTSVLEGLKLFVFTRFCDVTNILTGTVAVLVGWGVADRLRDSPVTGLVGRKLGAGLTDSQGRLRQGGFRLWVLTLILWVITVTVLNWQPFKFTIDPARFQSSDASSSDEGTARFGLRRMSWAPFVDYYWGSRYDALDQLVRRVLSFAPLGILFGLYPPPRGWRQRVLTLVLLALVVGTLIEAGQYFIPERHPSTTDLLIQIFGAWLGCKATQRVVWVLSTDAVAGSDPSAAAFGAQPHVATARQPLISRGAGFRDAQPAQHFLGDHARRILERFEASPRTVQLAVIGVVAVMLSVMLGLLLSRL